jgi:L-fuculose-phosphate aldolase
MHLALYRERPDIGAVIHTHSPYATTFACLEREIPPVHYLIAAAGTHVPCVPYAPFGTEALAESAASGIGCGKAVLLAHHGLVCVGADLADAFAVVQAVEFVAEIAWRVSCVGVSQGLSPEQLEDALRRMSRYGRSALAGEEGA